MKTGRFLGSLSLLGLLTVLLAFGQAKLALFKPYVDLTAWTAIFMALFAVLMYLLGVHTIKSTNPYRFIQIVIAGVLFKIILAIGLLALYVHIYQPESRYFVVPFVAIYLLYSIFETYAMYILALQKKTKQDE